jgi:hypothetical protein
VAEENSGESKNEGPQKEESRADRWLRRIKDHPVITTFIVIGSLALSLLTYANTFHEQWEKMLSWVHPPKPLAPFALRVDVIFQEEKTVFWVTKPYNPSIICEAALALVLSTTNLQSHPVVIDYFKVEALDANGKWAKIPHIDLLPQQHVYSGSDPTHVRVMTGELLENSLAGHHLIQPHEPVRGWTFFESPFLVSVVRVTVRDSEGVEFTSEPLFPPSQSIQMSSVTFGDEVIDVTKHQVDYHCGN